MRGLWVGKRQIVRTREYADLIGKSAMELRAVVDSRYVLGRGTGNALCRKPNGLSYLFLINVRYIDFHEYFWLGRGGKPKASIHAPRIAARQHKTAQAL